jgi:deoxycytidylate deaminase
LNHRNVCELLPILAEDHPQTAGQKIVAWLGFDKKYVFGYNRFKTHPLQKQFSHNKNRIYLHAEVDAITKFISQYVEIWKATMVVCRVSLGDLAACKPCESCIRAIVAFNIKRVYYSTNEGDFIRL